MTLKTIELITRLDAIAIVIDFRDVDYKWSNSLLRLFTAIEDHLFFRWHDTNMSVPIKLLASGKSIGLRSHITHDALFFESMEDAIRACDADVKTWLDN